MKSQNSAKLKIPRQELDQSSFFECDEQAVQSWIDELPMANLGESTRQLYEALKQLNQVRVLPANRLALLELLRTPVHYVSQALSKYYLNQPIVLPTHARKVSNLAHTLHTQLAVGYTIAASHLSTLSTRAHARINNANKLIACALHRAITDHTINIQRQFQLYESVNEGVWHKLHQYYCFAKQHKLDKLTIEDPKLANCTLETAYLRVILIGCSKPNQLRQEDFTEIFKPLADWAAMCKITSSSEYGLFVIDPSSDKPAVYSELYTSDLQENWFSLDTTDLVQHLKKLHGTPNPTNLKTNENENEHAISLDLLSHLKSAWSVMSKRSFMRIEANESLSISIGLNATHHFIAGEISFTSLIEKRGAHSLSMLNVNPFLNKPNIQLGQKDLWDSPYKANTAKHNAELESIDYQIRDHEGQLKTDTKEKYHRHDVTMINTSAHGYCIQLPTNINAQIKSGEIVGIKQHSSHNWGIGIIRWVSHYNEQHTQLGLELLSPSASPYGARIVHNKGSQAEYVRVLVLPEMPTIKRSLSLLTPIVPFKVGQKIVLNQRGREIQMSLVNKLNSTGAYCQFEYCKLGTKPETKFTLADADNYEENENNEFDSLWNNL